LFSWKDNMQNESQDFPFKVGDLIKNNISRLNSTGKEALPMFFCHWYENAIGIITEVVYLESIKNYRIKIFWNMGLSGFPKTETIRGQIRIKRLFKKI